MTLSDLVQPDRNPLLHLETEPRHACRIVDEILLDPPSLKTWCVFREAICEFPEEKREAVVHNGVLASYLAEEITIQDVEHMLRRPELLREIQRRILAPSDVVTQPAKVTAKAGRRRLILFSRAAAVFLAALTLGILGFKGLSWWQQYQELERRVHLTDYISFVGDDPDHPATDPSKAQPLFVQGQTVRLKGQVRGHLIDKIILRVEPGLTEQTGWELVTEVGETPDNEHALPVPFDVSFTAPRDGVRRLVTIELIPHQQAAQALGRHFHKEFVTYRVPLLCSAYGPVAYVGPEPVMVHNLQHGQLLNQGMIRVEGIAQQDGFFAVIVEDTVGSLYLQDYPVVVKAQQPIPPRKLHFGKPVGGRDEYVVHFAWFANEAAWPAEYRNWNLEMPIPERPRSALPGTEINYMSIRVRVKS